MRRLPINNKERGDDDHDESERDIDTRFLFHSLQVYEGEDASCENKNGRDGQRRESAGKEHARFDHAKEDTNTRHRVSREDAFSLYSLFTSTARITEGGTSGESRRPRAREAGHGCWRVDPMVPA